jgi:dicarboxylate/amino acid:cation (Na+ or H+) symporter, DAACS family
MVIYCVEIARMNLLAKWFKLKLWQQISIALVMGLLAGFLMGPKAAMFKPIGMIFINAIHMMVVPVVFTAIVSAVLASKASAKMGRIWFKAMAIYLVSMVIAATLGISLAELFHPGAGINIASMHIMPAANVTQHPPINFVTQIVNMVPDNPVKAFFDENVLQILVFAFIFGMAVNMAGEKAKPVESFFQSLAAVMFKFAGIIMMFAPYGIFALLAWVLGQFGVAALLPLLQLVGVVYLGCAIFISVYYFGSLLLMRVNPFQFFKKIFSAFMLAYTTSSSAATLPQSIRCAEENLKIDKSIAGFLLPLGATLNLNGLTIYITVATIFAANVFGIHLHTSQLFTIGVTTVLAAMGAAAVPGSALIVMGAVMGSVGIPLGAMPLIAGVDRLNDMAQTATNVTGDLFAAMVVAKTEPDAVLADDAIPAQAS